MIGEPGLRTDAEADLSARHEVAAHRVEMTGDLRELERLYDDGVARLGHANSVVLLVECSLEELRSRSRPVLESVKVWDELYDRAERVLPPGDPTLLAIKNFQARFRRQRGRRADLEEGVRSYYEQWRRRRETLGEDHYRTRTMYANLALAIRERDGEGDLAEALRMLREEAAHRVEAYGADHPFTWINRAVLAQTLARWAEHGPESSRAEHAREALELAETLVSDRKARFGATDIATLRAQLVHAHALILLGRAAEAVPEIQHVRLAARSSRVPLEPGWAESLLAQAQAATGSPDAVRTAEEAYRRRTAYYPPDSRKAVEAAGLLARLRSSSGG